LDWKKILDEYQAKHRKNIKPVSARNPNNYVPNHSICHHCGAPAQYLYFNDGKHRSQIKCKICNNLSQIHQKHSSKSVYFCPYCGYSLYLWKKLKSCFIYKCDNDKCSVYISNLNKLNLAERLLKKIKSSQFKLRYQFREYHIPDENLKNSSLPTHAHLLFSRLRSSLNTIALVLTFHVSFAISARKTALMLRKVFNIPLSYQSVLNYCELAASFCHKFNSFYKGDIDDYTAGDETYIKIKGKFSYTFLFISAVNHKITSYHVSHTRDVFGAVPSILEAIRTSKPDQVITIISDGNPAYQEAVHFINRKFDKSLSLKKVIGLQNLDEESEIYRPFKQLIERLNRTYKFHVRSAYGFNSNNGAIALTILFVTHYNFLRDHIALDYQTPIQLDFLKEFDTIQAQWAEILNRAFNLELTPQAA
jgi:transposase-like protein